MKRIDPRLRAFMTALRFEVDTNWKGMHGVLADDARISDSWLSEILSGKNNPSFKTQVKLAKACGYEYEEFLALGREILEGKLAKAHAKKQETKPIPKLKPAPAKNLKRRHYDNTDEWYIEKFKEILEDENQHVADTIRGMIYQCVELKSRVDDLQERLLTERKMLDSLDDHTEDAEGS